MFDSVKEVLQQACKEEGTTPLTEIVSAIGVMLLIPSIWLFLYVAGCK